MKRDAVISRLRAHEAELRQAGIERLSVFGSVAREEAAEASDVDLVAVFDKSRRLSLLDVIRLERRLSDLIGVPVDLVEEAALKPPVRAAAQRDAVRAF